MRVLSGFWYPEDKGSGNVSITWLTSSSATTFDRIRYGFYDLFAILEL